MFSECVDHFYGDMCRFQCGLCINGEACDKDTGICRNGCISNVQGNKCDGRYAKYSFDL